MTGAPFRAECQGAWSEFVTQIRGNYQWQAWRSCALNWRHATKDLLDDVCGAGSGGGFGAAVLVGSRSDHPYSGIELVDCLPERVVFVESLLRPGSLKKSGKGNAR